MTGSAASTGAATSEAAGVATTASSLATGAGEATSSAAMAGAAGVSSAGLTSSAVLTSSVDLDSFFLDDRPPKMRADRRRETLAALFCVDVSASAATGQHTSDSDFSAGSSAATGAASSTAGVASAAGVSVAATVGSTAAGVCDRQRESATMTTDLLDLGLLDVGRRRDGLVRLLGRRALVHELVEEALLLALLGRRRRLVALDLDILGRGGRVGGGSGRGRHERRDGLDLVGRAGGRRADVDRRGLDDGRDGWRDRLDGRRGLLGDLVTSERDGR